MNPSNPGNYRDPPGPNCDLPPYGTGDIIGVEANLDAKTVTFFKNGELLGKKPTYSLPKDVHTVYFAVGMQQKKKVVLMQVRSEAPHNSQGFET